MDTNYKILELFKILKGIRTVRLTEAELENASTLNREEQEKYKKGILEEINSYIMNYKLTDK